MSERLERILGVVGEGWITSEIYYVRSISTGRVYRSKTTGEYSVERNYRYLCRPTEGELKEIHGEIDS